MHLTQTIDKRWSKGNILKIPLTANAVLETDVFLLFQSSGSFPLFRETIVSTDLAQDICFPGQEEG